MAAIGIADIGPKGGDFDLCADPRCPFGYSVFVGPLFGHAPFSHQDDAKAGADRDALRKQFLNALRARIRGHVVIERLTPEQARSRDAAAHQISFWWPDWRSVLQICSANSARPHGRNYAPAPGGRPNDAAVRAGAG